MALCSLSTGRIATPRAARGLGDERARHDQHFLVGERDGLAGLDRREHGLEAAVPAEAQMTMSTDGCVATATRPSAPVPTTRRRRRAARRRAAGRRRRPSPWRRRRGGSARSARRAARRCRPPRARRPSGALGCASTTASALRPIDPVEPRMATRFTSRSAGTGRRPAWRTAARRCDRGCRRVRESAPSCPSRRRCA